MRALVALAFLCGCHSVLAIDPPPRGNGKTVLLLRQEAGELQTVHVLDGALPVLDLPAFSHQGVVRLAVVELKCPPAVFGLRLGLLTLLPEPLGARKLPEPLSVSAMTIEGDVAGAWGPPPEAPSWIDDALLRIDAPENLACSLRGRNYAMTRVEIGSPATLVKMPDGTAVVLSATKIQRLDARGTLTPLDITLPQVATPTLTVVGVRDPGADLWTLDLAGQLAHASLAPGAMQYVAAAPLPAGWNHLARDDRGGLYASKRLYQSMVPADIAYYDRQRDAWTPLFHAESMMMGIGLLNVYPLDHTLLVGGADLQTMPAHVFGAGRLLEIDPTSNGTVTLSWSQLPADDGKRTLAVGVADTRLYGRTMAANVCEAGSGGCAGGTTRAALRGILMRQAGGAWERIPGIETPYPITNIADGGADAVWVAGTQGFAFESTVTARFPDGTSCLLFEHGPLAPQIVELGEGVWAVSGSLTDTARRDIIDLYTPTSAPNDCAD